MFLINIQRDEIGIGGLWSEFIDYVVASIKSEDVKLILEGLSNTDGILSESFFFQYLVQGTLLWVVIWAGCSCSRFIVYL